MTTLREAATLALEALENTSPMGFNMERDKQFFAAITVLRTALAEPEQEPVAWANMRLDGRIPTMLSISQHPEDRANWVNPVPLYTHPAPHPVELTDEEIWKIYDDTPSGKAKPFIMQVVRAVIEAYQRKQEGKHEQ